jgi:hypothetical protein
MKCQNCGKTVPENAKVCGYCGTKIEKVGKKFCPNCGKEIPADAKVCGLCGFNLSAPAVEAPPAKGGVLPRAAKPAGERKPIPKNLLIIGGIVVGVVIIAIVLLLSMTNGRGVVFELGGTWSGSGNSITIIFELGDACPIGSVCGTFEIPYVVSGDVVFTKIEGSRHVFQTINLSSGEPSTAEYEFLELRSDGKLRYYSKGDYGTNDFLLTRTD